MADFIWMRALGFTLLLMTGCATAPPVEPRQDLKPSITTTVESSTPSDAVHDVRTSPTMEALDVPGYLPAVLAVPSGETAAPVVIVTHGAGGRPEPDCARYLELTQGAAFLVCIRGRAMNAMLPFEERRYYYDGHIELGRELRAALGALGERYPKRADLEDVTFAGYSQGAAMGILYLETGGAREAHVRRVMLVEGGAGTWSIAMAEGLRHDGVEKVAIVCGQRSCHEQSERSGRWIRSAGLELDIRYAEGAGHTHDGPVRPLVDAAWAWLVTSDVDH